MASANDVKIEKDVWTDLTAAAGAVAGDDIRVQNLGGHDIRVETADAQPSGDIVGTLVGPRKQALAETTASEKVWGFGRGSASTVNLQVLP